MKTFVCLAVEIFAYALLVCALVVQLRAMPFADPSAIFVIGALWVYITLDALAATAWRKS